jgi:hypothetical protein
MTLRSSQIVPERHRLHLQHPQLFAELEIPSQTEVIDEIGHGPLDRTEAAAIGLAGRRANVQL